MSKTSPISINLLMLLMLLTLSVSSCIIHKIDIQQGNVVTVEMLENVSTGMNTQQVMSIIGTPLITDPFRSGQWEYVYSLKLGDSKEEQFSYITLHFVDNILDKIDIKKKPLKESEIKTLAKKSKRSI